MWIREVHTFTIRIRRTHTNVNYEINEFDSAEESFLYCVCTARTQNFSQKLISIFQPVDIEIQSIVDPNLEDNVF